TFDQVDLQESKNVMVIGATVATVLFPAQIPIGQQVKVRGCYFTVIGVAAEKSLTGRSESAGFEDTGSDVYIPFSTRRLFFGEYEVNRQGGRITERNWVRYHRFVVRVGSMEQVSATAALIQQLLKTTHKRQDYDIMVPLELLRQAEHTKRIFNIVLGSIAAISLVVGGIGIMNIMLATVTERTREIGIRRALGARRRDILQQFVSEAVILSSSGGLIGVCLGVIIPKIVTRLAGMTTLITPWSVLISFSISVGVGMVFGIYPARQAASLDPIQALRYE
ncbi:MAG TPA: ABC transporter permease, partial [bacterium]|nr:ABC transporter permease [bacterium]